MLHQEKIMVSWLHIWCPSSHLFYWILYHRQIHFSCPLARNYIWMSKRKETAPKVECFLLIWNQFTIWRPMQNVLLQKGGIFEHTILVSLVFSYQCILIRCTIFLYLTMSTFSLQSLPLKESKHTFFAQRCLPWSRTHRYRTSSSKKIQQTAWLGSRLKKLLTLKRSQHLTRKPFTTRSDLGTNSRLKSTI